MITTIFLVRHGETQWVKDDRFTGISDIDLTDHGRTQAEMLGHYIQPTPVNAVYTSPLRRCQATAGILNTWQVPQIADGRIREINYGVWEGMQRDAIVQQYGVEYQAWGDDPATLAPPEGETGQEVLQRGINFWQDLLHRHEGQHVLVVAHKTVNRILLCWLLGIPIQLYRWRIGQHACALNVIRIQEHGPLIERLNFTLDS